MKSFREFLSEMNLFNPPEEDLDKPNLTKSGRLRIKPSRLPKDIVPPLMIGSEKFPGWIEDYIDKPEVKPKKKKKNPIATSLDNFIDTKPDDATPYGLAPNDATKIDPLDWLKTDSGVNPKDLIKLPPLKSRLSKIKWIEKNKNIPFIFRVIFAIGDLTRSRDNGSLIKIWYDLKNKSIPNDLIEKALDLIKDDYGEMTYSEFIKLIPHLEYNPEGEGNRSKNNGMMTNDIVKKAFRIKLEDE